MFDAFGLEVSTRSAEACAAFNEGLQRMLYQQGGSEQSLALALSLDPEFALAQALQALSLRGAGRIAEGNAALKCSAELSATTREHELIEGLVLMFSGHFDEADGALAHHLTQWPSDAVALFVRMSILNLFSSRTDRDREMLRAVESCLPAYQGHPYVLGAYAFALEENRRFVEAHAVANDAVRLLPHNARASHALAHTYLETGQQREGERFITRWLASWEHPGPFACHLTWHRALSALTRDDRAVAEEGLRDVIGFKGRSIAVLTDAASLGWRLFLDGSDPDWLWEELLLLPDAIGNRFANAHRAMVLAGADEQQLLVAYIEALRKAGGHNVFTAGWAEALLLYRRGHMAAAADALTRLTPYFRVLGGSQAQTDVFRETHLSALQHGGRRREAMVGLGRRLEQRPSSRDERWMMQLS